MIHILDVYLDNALAGELSQDNSGRLSFKYNGKYLNNINSPALSITMPLRSEPFDDPLTHAFFAGLLPEGAIRTQLANHFKISEKNAFGLLEAIGGDCAGAVALYPKGERPIQPKDNFFNLLSDSELEKILITLSDHPFLADQEDMRLSLAGAQNKLPVIALLGHDSKNRNFRIGLPKNLPSAHIIKTPIRRFEDTVQNEFFCMQLAKKMSLNVPETGFEKLNQIDFFIVARYDRKQSNDEKIFTRLHQEDFCQAMGIQSNLKYQNEGGPSIAACLNLIEKYSANPAVDRLEFLKRIIFNFLIGNADAHGKNFSFLYINKKPILAPAYDLLSTAVYPDINKKMAMKIGSQYDAARVFLRHWHSLVGDTATAQKSLETDLQFFANKLPGLAAELQKNLTQTGMASPIFQKIQNVIEKRATHILKYFGT